MNKEVKQFIRRLEKRGWYKKRQSGTGHTIMFYPPGGQKTVLSTPSDFRWLYKAEADVRRIEEQFGPYTPPEKERNERGLDYRPPELTIEIPEIIIDEPQLNIEILKPITNLPEPIIKLHKSKENFMSGLDKDIVIQVLQEKYTQLKVQIEPYIALFEEYDRIKKALATLGRIDKPDAEKVAEFLEKKPEKVVKKHNRPRISSMQVYQEVCEILQANNNKMEIPEVLEWLTTVKGYTLGNPNSKVAPQSDLVARIQNFNKEHPDQKKIFLFPEKELGAGKVKAYEWMEYRGVA